MTIASADVLSRQGGLVRAAARLGEAGISIDYGYRGVAPGTNATFLILGVAEAGEAVNIFDQSCCCKRDDLNHGTATARC